MKIEKIAKIFSDGDKYLAKDFEKILRSGKIGAEEISRIFACGIVPTLIHNIFDVMISGGESDISYIAFTCVMDAEQYTNGVLPAANGVDGQAVCFITFDGQESVKELPEFMDRKKFVALDDADTVRVYLSKAAAEAGKEFRRFQAIPAARDALSHEVGSLLDGGAVSLVYNLESLGVFRAKKFQVMQDGSLEGLVVLRKADGSCEKRLVSIGDDEPDGKLWDKSRFWFEDGQEVYLSTSNPAKEVVEELDTELASFSAREVYGYFKTVSDYGPFEVPKPLF